MSKYTLSLLGRFELSGPDGPIDLTSQKLAALLAFLACTAPQPHGRDKLMTLLWGSHFDAQARQNLRQALTRLRRVLGDDALISNGETVALRLGMISCDVARFEALVCDGSRGALDEAVSLYRDRLLAEIEIPEEAWTEWLGVQRQRLEGLALDAMVKLGEQELHLGDHEQALRAANRAIAVSSLREDAHRLLMRALAAGGRRADALRHYEELSALLKRELTVEPDPSTRALAAELRKPHAARSPSEARSGPPAEPNDATESSPVHLSLPDRPSIAVLPFTNMSGDPEQEYFGDGLAEEILTALSKWRWFLVFARNSTFTFKDKPISAKQIGKALGARYILDGSVRRAGSRVRVAAQLIEAATERHIWADRYDRDISDVFAVQDDITRNVVCAIDPAIQVSELDHIARKPPDSMDAWDHFLRGCYHHHLFRARDERLAVQHLSRAVEIDPQFAAAHARLALALGLAASLGKTPDAGETLAAALRSAETAIALDAFDASAHAAASYALVYSRQYDAGLEAGRRGVELNDNYHMAHFVRAMALLLGGAPEESITEFEITARLSPLDPAAWSILGMRALAHYTARQYEAAREAADAALVKWPDFAGARIVKAAAQVRLGQAAEAAGTLADVPGTAFFQLSLTCPFRHQADWEHLLTALEEARRE
jgi:TolB-like protein